MWFIIFGSLRYGNHGYYFQFWPVEYKRQNTHTQKPEVNVYVGHCILKVINMDKKFLPWKDNNKIQNGDTRKK